MAIVQNIIENTPGGRLEPRARAEFRMLEGNTTNKFFHMPWPLQACALGSRHFPGGSRGAELLQIIGNWKVCLTSFDWC
eukprot:6485197-Amphidinium_carterae.1